MANWTVLGKTSNSKHFGVTLNTDKMQWTVGGPSAAEVFTTRQSRYISKPAPELGTSLLPSTGNNAVAIFTRLHGASAAGATGRGKQFETANVFDWKLDSQ